MGAQLPDYERQWAAEKRDFVADRRDEVAAERDAVADERDTSANQRQAVSDERERQLDGRAVDLELPVDSTDSVARRAQGRVGREQSGQAREGLAAERDAAAAARDEAAGFRLNVTPTTRLASAFADIAEQLYAVDTFEEVLERIAQTAVRAVGGCQMASVTLRDDRGYQTAAATALAASEVDQAQYDAQEGPCVDAGHEPMVYAQAFPDGRWPVLASRPVDFGARSAVSYQLTAASLETAGTSGSLNAYAVEPAAFSDEARNIGQILAAHASTAAGAVHERCIAR